jgi:hypothetical protein
MHTTPVTTNVTKIGGLATASVHVSENLLDPELVN